MIEDDQNAAARHGAAFFGALETPGDAPVGEGSVIRPVVLELPTQKLLEERFRGSEVGGLEFDVIDLVCRVHDDSPGLRFRQSEL